MADPKIVVLLGPTAVGKTELSIHLAQRLDAEIVSADSRLLYRGVDIGTAKPSPVQQTRVPHHLIDVADPRETWSLALFQEAVHNAILDITGRGHLPLLVGGAGQYLRAIVEGWSPPLLEGQPGLRAALEEWASLIGKDGLHARLAILDSTAAANIDARNLRRTVRALEVILATGRLYSDQRGRRRPRYDALQIGLNRPRSELYARIDVRIEGMMAVGWLDECRRLLAAGYSPNLPSLSAIGYSQLFSYLRGEIRLEEALIKIKRSTRTFVRRQANWFKPGDPLIHWFEMNEESTIGEIERLIREFASDGSEGEESTETNSSNSFAGRE